MKPENAKILKQYTLPYDAWYADSIPDTGNVDQITIGYYHESGGTYGEFQIRWCELGENEPVAARIEAFNESWDVLLECADIFKYLKKNYKNMSSCDVAKVLEQNGFEDRTERVRPTKGVETKPSGHRPK